MNHKNKAAADVTASAASRKNESTTPVFSSNTNYTENTDFRKGDGDGPQYNDAVVTCLQILARRGRLVREAAAAAQAGGSDAQ